MERLRKKEEAEREELRKRQEAMKVNLNLVKGAQANKNQRGAEADPRS
jgi:hypothetical protein